MLKSKISILLACACLAPLLVSCGQPEGQSAKSAAPTEQATIKNETAKMDKQLDAFFDDYWQNELRDNPFLATTSGVDTYNADVPDVSPQAYQQRLERLKSQLEKLNSLDTNQAAPDHKLSADLLKFILKHDIAQLEFSPWRIPFLADSGFHSDIGYVVSATSFRTVNDYDLYLARLEKVPAWINQNIDNMRIGLADGFTQPAEIMPNILPSFDAQVTATVEDHPLYAPFLSMPMSFSETDKTRLQDQAKRAVESNIIPAYIGLRDFMRDEYTPNARRTIGASQWPQGEAYYEELIRYYTTLDDATANAIHQRGLNEVARIRGEMDEVIATTGFTGSFAEFLTFLREDPQFYPKTGRELLEFASFVSKKIDGRLPAYFGRLPRQPYSVEPVPAEIAPNYTAGRYVPAPPSATRGGQYWVNTYALNTRGLYQIPALSLHEAVPGHHLQGALSYEIENAPEFRLQFYPHAYGEGWALYAEKLGVEMGIYETPYEDFGRLSYEMWRACRLVIDTGLHSQGWTRQQAMDYLAANTALSLHEIQTETDRYIAWPGQALAYKMGELTIWDLRHEAETQLGADFDIRKFHDAVLKEGGLPLGILSERIRNEFGLAE